MDVNMLIFMLIELKMVSHFPTPTQYLYFVISPHFGENSESEAIYDEGVKNRLRRYRAVHK